MKKISMKTVAFAVVLCLMLTMISACGGDTTKTGQTTAGTAGTSATETTPAKAEKITLKFLVGARPDFEFTNDMPVFQELEKRTNVHLEWQLLPATDADQKFNLIMASNELPDLISYMDGPTLNKYGTQGAFIALNDLIDQEAPNLKKIMADPPFPMPYIKAEMKASDGNIYSIPFLTQTVTGEIFCVRQDWLTKLNLSVPDTTEDLYKVLKAFKENDPNGNGKADEVPFSTTDLTWDITAMMNAFGAHEGYYIASDNTIKYGPMEDRYQEGLGYASKLIKEGLIDKEFLSLSYDQFMTKVSNNTVGMFYAWPFSGLGACNTLLQKTVPDGKYIAMIPVKGPHGDRFKERPQNSILPRTVITKDNKYPKETMRYLDYLFSDEGSLLMNWGIEGKDYTLVNGKPQFTDYILKNPDGKDVATARAQEGMQMALPTIATLDPEKAAVSDQEVSRAWQIYADAKVLVPPFPSLPFTTAQLTDVNQKGTEIDTYLAESLSKFLLGETPNSDFPKFVDQLKKMGIEDVLKIYNDAYKKYADFNK